MKKEILTKLEELLKVEAFETIQNEGRELVAQFKDIREKEMYRPDTPEAENSEEDKTGNEILNDRISVYIQQFNERKKEFYAKRKATQDENLKRKKEIIVKIETIAQEENLGVAYGSFKELKEAWDKSGSISREASRDVQTAYSKAVETFYYNMNIYRELKEHDLKKNYSLKNQLVHRLTELQNADSLTLRELEEQVKEIRKEWDEIGATFKEEWETLKESYWVALKSVFDRIDGLYKAKNEEAENNLKKKLELISKAKEVTAISCSTSKDWEKSTQSIIVLQREWKEIGFVPKAQNEDTWKEFRSECDSFFSLKKDYFDDRKSEFELNKDAKKSLIDKIEKFKHSTDWKKTTQQILKVQEDWKRIGSAGPRYEQKLWKKFRSFCDEFFTSKQNHFESLISVENDNLKLKETLIEEIKSFSCSGVNETDLIALKEFSVRFGEIGNVPFKVKDSIYKLFSEAMDHHYAGMKMDALEKENLLFRSRVENLAVIENADFLLGKEREKVVRRLKKIDEEIKQYENNMGFFANSKGANSMKEQLETNIIKLKKDIKVQEDRLMIIDSIEVKN